MINVRQYKILQRLINDSETAFGKQIAATFQVSERTIRNDIDSINDFLSSTGIQIHANPRYGYWIENKDKSELSNLIIEKQYYSPEELPNEAEEREIYIYFSLLAYTSYTTMNRLSEEIYVSKTTISQMIRNMKGLINLIDGVSLETSKTNGIRLTGNEYSIRKLISAIILYYYDINPNFLTHSIHHFFDKQNNLYQIYNYLKDSRFNQENPMTQKSLKMFSMEIVIFAYRNRINQFIEEISGDIPKNFPVTYLNKSLETSISQNDLRLLNQCLERKRFISTEENIKEEDIVFHNIITDYCELVRKTYSLDLSNEKQIISHLYHMFSTYDITFRNNDVDIEDIKRYYSFAYKMASQIDGLTYNRLQVHIPDLELCRLALRIQIVLDKRMKKIPTVLVTNSETYASFLKNKIDLYFKNNIDLIRTCEPYQLQRVLDSNDVKLILSTVMFSNDSDIRILYISPILKNRDINSINNYIYENAKYE